MCVCGGGGGGMGREWDEGAHGKFWMINFGYCIYPEYSHT